MAFKLLLLLFSTFLSTFASDECPSVFDPSVCSCFTDDGNPRHFIQVACESETLPNLSGSSKTKNYSADYLTIISPEAYKLPADYFGAFSDIQTLVLVRNDSYIQQQFDTNVFKDVQFNDVTFVGIDGLLPPPEPLTILATNSLPGGLTISQHGPANLTDSCFVDFAGLKSLSVTDTPIERIDEYAFNRLGRLLLALSLDRTGLTELPTSAFGYLLQLTTLSAVDNNIHSIAPRSFNLFPKLQKLYLSGNPIASDILKGNLNGLPPTVVTLGLANVGLKTIPTYLLTFTPYDHYLDLSDNEISLIKNTDFIYSSRMTALNLNNNPLDKIERGSFQFLNNLTRFTMSNTSISNFDLTVFAGMGVNDRVRADLSGNSHLKTLDVSTIYMTPRALTIKMTNTGLQEINSRCKSFFDNRPAFYLDLSDNANLQCKGLEWIAPYIFCTSQVKVDNGTLCADESTTLTDYLKTAVPNPCAGYSTTTGASGSTSTVGTTEQPPPTTTYTGSAGIARAMSFAVIIQVLLALLFGKLN